MKGYQIENVLYIFPQDAAQIPSVAETVEAIAIQPELLEAFKALNEGYADIMVPYNYNTMTVKAKPWADYVNEDIPLPTYDVTVSGSNVTTTSTTGLHEGDTFKFKVNDGYTLTSASAVCGEDAVTITDLVDDADGYTKAFTMPYGNVTLTVVTELIPVLVTYDYACYSTLEEETAEVTGQFTSYGEVTRTDTVDGVELQLIPCTVTQSTQEAMVGATIYADANDMQYIGTDTKCKYYVLVEDVMAWSQYYVTISIAE